MHFIKILFYYKYYVKHIVLETLLILSVIIKSLFYRIILFNFCRFFKNIDRTGADILLQLKYFLFTFISLVKSFNKTKQLISPYVFEL